MDVPASPQEKDILDLRMEYPLLMQAGFNIHNMYWLGYGAFFAINTLLATVLGVSYSAKASTISTILVETVRIMVPIIGMFVSICAIYTAQKLAKFERIIVLRGIDIENILSASIFSKVRSDFQTNSWLTEIASLLFLLTWAGALYSAFL